MNNIKQKLTYITLIAAVTSLSACSDEPAPKAANYPTATAQTMTVQQQAVPAYYTTSGTVTSDHRVSISSRLSGYIRELTVREGDQVKAGQILVRVDPVDAKQALIQAKADLADAEADLNRYKELFKSGAVSKQQLSKIELRYTVAKSQVKQASNQLSYAEVRSPVAGVVVEKRLSQGDLAAPGMPILTIEDPTSLLVETYVSEGFISKIHENAIVDVTIPSLHQTFEGTVRQVVQAADPVSHQFLVKVALKASADIHPGMFAQAGFRVGERQAIIVPQSTLKTHSGLHAVYVLDAHGISQYRLVRLGQTLGDKVEIVAGLHDGDTIVWGNPNIKTGMKIQAENGK
ncbi:efflux RND transporter periplasmic adaptor subunit [Ghiorsea bivora]|uniref:efflux RND transporter periplasmic adaptor subunit n=1 Tax=Ghiorsea bivora TaxID=1485545 RepID=UPI00068FE655|nr:efflux RND transporter periplasmic adaptor subunit [Ghiorsea bivora]